MAEINPNYLLEQFQLIEEYLRRHGDRESYIRDSLVSS